MADDFSDKKVLISQYNEAAFQIARLNNLWQLCNNYARAGDLDQWKWVLDRIWIELSADAKQKDETQYFNGIKVLNISISKAEGNANLYNTLQEKEIFLKGLQEGVGKGGKKSEEYTDW